MIPFQESLSLKISSNPRHNFTTKQNSGRGKLQPPSHIRSPLQTLDLRKDVRPRRVSRGSPAYLRWSTVPSSSIRRSKSTSPSIPVRNTAPCSSHARPSDSSLAAMSAPCRIEPFLRNSWSLVLPHHRYPVPPSILRKPDPSKHVRTHPHKPCLFRLTPSNAAAPSVPFHSHSFRNLRPLPLRALPLHIWSAAHRACDA